MKIRHKSGAMLRFMADAAGRPRIIPPGLPWSAPHGTAPQSFLNTPCRSAIAICWLRIAGIGRLGMLTFTRNCLGAL